MKRENIYIYIYIYIEENISLVNIFVKTLRGMCGCLVLSIDIRNSNFLTCIIVYIYQIEKS